MPKTLTTEQKKAKLQAELKQIEQSDEQNFGACLKEIMKLPEAKQVKHLCIFRQKWEIGVVVKVECDFNVPPFNKEVGDSCQGGVYADMKETKGYNIQPFLAEDLIGNVGMGGEDDMATVSPEIRKQFKSLLSAEKSLKKKAIKIAKKYGYGWDDIRDALVDELEA